MSPLSPTTTYLDELARYFRDSNSSEMSYRTPFQHWLGHIFPKEDGFLIQHDQRSISGNKPDFVVIKNEVPLLYIEVKKIGEDLNKIAKSSQASRYFGYANLIITDYLDFRFFRNGQVYEEAIVLGSSDKSSRSISPTPEQGERLVRTIKDFVSSHKEPIRSGKHLAKIMGGRAQRIRDNVIDYLQKETANNASLFKIMQVIKDNLITDISIASFADMYAQTLVYGLFAARYSDQSMSDFSRQEARDLIPANNPFLQHFFDHIAGTDFPARLDLIVRELCEVFTHADVHALLAQYYSGERAKALKDPVVHFYEDFLLEYDPSKKMEMGVFYTPLPIVRFILRSVDSILKNKFQISAGLADNHKISTSQMVSNAKGKLVSQKTEYHRVQILDFATGTGTFLHELVTLIYQSFSAQTGRWPAYVQSDLLPRLHGFELMVASYTIAHIKLGLVLQETGVKALERRLGIYLTNSLDAAVDHTAQGTLFGLMESIADESYSASRVKKDYPVMVVVGNPPYSGVSQNKQFTDNSVYKVEPGGKEKLQERKNWLDDDYVKFIRLAESLVEKNQEGVIGLITAHGYIDNPTFRGMRWHLRQTFDEIYIIDLHGNANKKETTPEGGKDENVFDIKTGVAIILGVRNKRAGGQKAPATIYKYDLSGLRKDKFAFLNEHDVSNIHFEKLPKEVEAWKKTGRGEASYKQGFSVADLFPVASTGIVSMGDSFIIDQNRENLIKRVQNFLDQPISEASLKQEYGLGKNYAKWVIANKAQITLQDELFVPLAYRPFDTRYTYFDNKLVWRPRTAVMSNFLQGENVGLVTARSNKNPDPNHFFISKYITETKLGESSTQSCVFPLYFYSPDGSKQANLDPSLWRAIDEAVGGATTPEDVLDYVYAYLHAPSYRQQYSEFLKTDFPRVPFPASGKIFAKLVSLGQRLRALHLMTDPVLDSYISTYPVVGDDMVTTVKYLDERVYINDTQYFGQVPAVAWNFFIGGYQPAQKWLKDRRGQRLRNSDLDHYQRMIVALVQTSQVMAEVDEVVGKI